MDYKTGIYRYTNLINGKRYIGQAKDINKRYLSHLKHSSYNTKNKSAIDQAINKYGIDNFRFEILEFCEPEQLNELETYWIMYYNTNIYNGGYGYNKNNGGDGHGGKSPMEGKHFSDESKQKMRKAKIGSIPWNKGKTGIYSEDTLNKIRNGPGNKGQHWKIDPITNKRIYYKDE